MCLQVHAPSKPAQQHPTSTKNDRQLHTWPALRCVITRYNPPSATQPRTKLELGLFQLSHISHEFDIDAHAHLSPTSNASWQGALFSRIIHHASFCFCLFVQVSQFPNVKGVQKMRQRSKGTTTLKYTSMDKKKLRETMPSKLCSVKKAS